MIVSAVSKEEKEDQMGQPESRGLKKTLKHFPWGYSVNAHESKMIFLFYLWIFLMCAVDLEWFVGAFSPEGYLCVYATHGLTYKSEIV